MPESRRVEVGKVEQFHVGVFRRHVVEGREIGVVRLTNGEFRAVLNYCPHRGAPVCRGTIGGTWPPCEPGDLTFDREGEILTCPWHGWEFDLQSGQQLFQRRPTRLRMFQVSVEGGVVSVMVP